jgi:hypothetical protein
VCATTEKRKIREREKMWNEKNRRKEKWWELRRHGKA